GLIAAVMGHTSGAINSVTTIATMDFFIPLIRRRSLSEPAQVIAEPIAAASNTGNSARVLDYASREIPPGQHREATDEQAVRFGRIFGIIAIVIGVICAVLLTEHSKKPIFLYLLNAYGYFTPGIATMFLLGILWKRTTAAGALTAGILTIPLSLAL